MLIPAKCRCMRIGEVTKARIVFAIVFGVLIGVGEVIAIKHISLAGLNVALFLIGTAGVGLLSWCAGQFIKPLAKGPVPVVASPDAIARDQNEKYSSEDPLISPLSPVESENATAGLEGETKALSSATVTKREVAM